MIVLTVIQDIMMKPVHDIIQRYHHWPGTHSIPPTNQEEEYTAKSNLQPCPQRSYLKIMPQARLSILILSKTYPTSGIYLADF
jgi:hypothetical protein